MIWIFLICALLGFFVLYVKRHHSYWERKGVPYMKPTFLTGNMSFFRKIQFGDRIKEFYNECPGTRYHGGFMFLNPFLFIKDVDLIKQILVKDFDHFTDRRKVVTEDIDPLWAKNLTNAGGDLWRNLRSTLSPSFTASKMKIMFNLMEECAEQFIEYFKNDQSEIVEVEIKDALSRYTNDVIATTAFGFECNSFKNRNNEFFMMGKDVSNLGLLRLLRFLVFSISPTLTKLLDIKAIPPHIAKYFTKVIEDVLKFREEKNIVRPDMIHLMMETRKGHNIKDEDLKVNEGFSLGQNSELKSSTKYQLTEQDMISQAFVFFLAGFDGMSTLLSFTMYELSLNPEIQDRLREEINTVSGKITYEKLLKLKYLDMVVSETLRKWSPASFTDRICTKEYTIAPKNPGEIPVTLKVGDGCMIPIWPVHMDPKYYPEPEKFDPDRFSDENKHNIHPGAYMPFGAGPRFCVGNRFALLEGKLMLFYALKYFEVVPVKKTPIPMVLDTNLFSPNAKGGMWLGLKKITA